MEIERSRDYQIDLLIVYQSDTEDKAPKVSLMLRALLQSLGFEPKPYLTVQELKGMVQDFCRL